MSRVDALSDFLTRVRNANLVFHDSTIAPYSEMNSALALILKKQGYVVVSRRSSAITANT